jgi:hypothetical protein
MAAGQPLKLYGGAAEDLCRRVELGDAAALSLLQPMMSLPDYVGVLCAHGAFAPAVALLAAGMPKREAVWWGCLASRLTLHLYSEQSELPLKAAEAWVYKPSEEARRAAMAAARLVGFNCPASWAAVAVFWSGGSMAPADAPIVPPGEQLTARAVTGAVTLSAVQKEPEQAMTKYRRLVEIAFDVASGGDGRKLLNTKT